MHIPIRKVAYVPNQKMWFSVIITDRRKSQEKPKQQDYRIDALSSAAAQCQALCLYLKDDDDKERERAFETELVTASVLTAVDKDGRIVPFNDKRLSGPARVAFLVFMTLLICAGIWLMIAGLSQAFDIINTAISPVKSG